MKDNVREKIFFSHAENMRICNFIVAEYKNSGLDDIAFAKFATEKLSLSSELHRHQVRHRRVDLKIAANKPRSIPEMVKGNAIAMLGALAERVTVLENRLKRLEGIVSVSADA